MTNPVAVMDHKRDVSEAPLIQSGVVLSLQRRLGRRLAETALPLGVNIPLQKGLLAIMLSANSNFVLLGSGTIMQRLIAGSSTATAALNSTGHAVINSLKNGKNPRSPRR